MELDYQLSKKDFIDFLKLYLKDIIQKKLGIFIVIAFVLFAVLNGQTFIWWRFLIALVASPAIIWLIFYFIPLVISILRLNRIADKDKAYFNKRKITLLDDGIKTESEHKVDIWKWQAIKSVHSNDKFIYFILIDKKAIPVPKNIFLSESEAINFLALVQSNLPIVTGASTLQVSYKNKKPSYLTGLICLIPIVGLIVGIIYIVNGISRYKDKWFVIMGAGGVLVTVCFWYFIFYSNTFGFKNMIAESSQRQLNSLMKAVEFYKLKNGVYPDSLVQVTYDNSDIWIYDPLTPGEHVNKSNEYNYQKVGDHYYLYSSGVDGIPNTKDDIYPQVAKSDSAKFGLIRK